MAATLPDCRAPMLAAIREVRLNALGLYETAKELSRKTEELRELGIHKIALDASIIRLESMIQDEVIP